MKVSLHKRISRNLRGRLRSKVLANHGVGIVTATRNGTLVVDPADFNVSRQLLTRGEYDWPEVTLLSGLVTATSRIVFVGAHIGALLVPIVRASGTRSVVAYEPSPRNYRLLLMNLALNEISGIVSRNIAVGALPGKVRFTENRSNTGNSRVASAAGEIEVEVRTLDATIPSTWDVIDLMVMDIEGSESDAMRGAMNTLARTRRFYVEFAPEQLIEQGSTVEEFVALAASHFSSAYIIGRERNEKTRFLPPGEFPGYLRAQPQRRGLLLNILFSRDAAPAPEVGLRP